MQRAARCTAITATARCASTATTAARRATNPTATASGLTKPDDSEPPLSIEGAADHWNHRADADYYSQPGVLFRLMTTAQQRALFDNTARSIGGAPRALQLRHIRHCMQADPAYGAGIARALGIPDSEAG